MAGAMFVLGECYCCHRVFAFSPTWVPSVPPNLTKTGVKEPICESCINRANPERLKNGLDPIKIHPNAYTAEEC